MAGYYTNGVPQGNAALGTFPFTGNETMPMDTNLPSGGGAESIGPSSKNVLGFGAPYANGNWTGAVTLDASNGPRQTATLTGNITLGNVTNAVSGQLNILTLTQDATGSRTLTVGSMWTFPGGTKTLSTPASSIDSITWWYDSTANKIRALLDKAFA